MMYASDGRILIRLPMAGYEDLECFKPGFGQPSDPRLKLKVVKQVDKTFAHGEGRILGLADVPIVSNPCSEPGPCPRTLNEVSGPADSYCDCDSCSGTFRIDDPVGGVPIGERDHRMALRYVYLLRYFGVHRVELPMHPETEPFRFEIGQVAGIVMPMTLPHRRLISPSRGTLRD